MGLLQKKISYVAVLLVFMLLTGCIGGFGYSITGKVVDSDNKGLDGVEIVVTGGTNTTVTTESDGTFRLTRLKGTCTITPTPTIYNFTPEEEKVSAQKYGLLFEAIAKEADEEDPPEADLTVKSVSALEDINVKRGGAYTLPENVEITLSDDSTKTVPVTWEDTANVNKIGTYELEGTLDLSALENVAETDKVAKVNVVVTVEVEEVKVSAISVNKEATTLAVGATETLVATVLPPNATNKTVTWTSSDANVATVDGGVVTAVGEGEATITAKAGSYTATCEVTVVEVAVSKLAFDYYAAGDRVLCQEIVQPKLEQILLVTQPLLGTLLAFHSNMPHTLLATNSRSDCDF